MPRGVVEQAEDRHHIVQPLPYPANWLPSVMCSNGGPHVGQLKPLEVFLHLPLHGSFRIVAPRVCFSRFMYIITLGVPGCQTFLGWSYPGLYPGISRARTLGCGSRLRGSFFIGYRFSAGRSYSRACIFAVLGFCVFRTSGITVMELLLRSANKSK